MASIKDQSTRKGQCEGCVMNVTKSTKSHDTQSLEVNDSIVEIFPSLDKG